MTARGLPTSDAPIFRNRLNGSRIAASKPLLQLSLRFQGRTFGAPGLTART